jgi:hypothetical protein
MPGRRISNKATQRIYRAGEMASSITVLMQDNP